MSSRRTLILLGAIALGVLAAFALFQYVSGIEDEVRKDIEPVQVFKATGLIERGVDGNAAAEQGLIESSEISREFLPEGQITSLSQIQGKVAIFDIPAGIPITTSMFVDQSEVQVSFRRRLEQPDWVTVTVSVDEIRGVAGLLQPGDEVNIMAAVNLGLPGEDIGEAWLRLISAPPTSGVVMANRYEVVYQKVHVLAVGQSASLLPGEEAAAEDQQQAVNAGLVTFNVPADAAQLIASAQLASTIYLSLVPEDYEPEPIEMLEDAIEDLPGQNNDQLTPYGPDGDGRE